MNARNETTAVLHRFSAIQITDCEANRRLTVSASQLKEKYECDIPTGTYRLRDLLEILLK
ncbi:MAG: hypothetical protein IBX41_05070 [Methanophagales archaeon]|nr:hypothetical protein [Methanophagales archaeon]